MDRSELRHLLLVTLQTARAERTGVLRWSDRKLLCSKSIQNNEEETQFITYSLRPVPSDYDYASFYYFNRLVLSYLGKVVEAMGRG